MSDSNSNPEKLILVIHGVGDPAPGETLSLFARSLADPAKPMTETRDTLWLSEKSERDGHVQTFPVHQRRIKSETGTIELCEGFWGDLSRVRRGWIGILQGILKIIFGLRYVAYVAADQPGPAAYWLKRLGLVSSRILHGPVLAVTFYLAILMIAVCGTQLMWPESYKASIWTQVVLAGCSMIALLSSAVGHHITRSSVIQHFWFWVNVTAVFVTGLMFLKALMLDYMYPDLVHSCPIHPGLLWYCRVLLVLLGLLWFVEIQVLVGMAACWFAALRHPRAYRPALHVAFLLPALAVGVWGQVLPMMWLSAKEGISVLAELPEFSAVFDDAIPFLGVQLLMMAVVLVAASFVLHRYYRWRSQATVEHYNDGNRGRRLIVNESLQLTLAICTVVGVTVVSSLCLIELMEREYTDFAVGRFMAEVNKYAIGVLVPMTGLIVVLMPRLRPAFDMMLDVVNHFYFRPTDLNDVLDDFDDFDIAETTFENGAMFFSRRDATHVRIKKILMHYREKYSHHPELIVLSHSQGTMLAVEVLNDEELAWLNTTFSSVTLVTMGSPLTHLYQHYFGHYYPSLELPFWSALQQRTKRWINIFRIDDYVGTEVVFPEFGRDNLDDQLKYQNLPAFEQLVRCSNHAVGPRGHASYWSDKEVLELIREKLFASENSVSQKRRAA